MEKSLSGNVPRVVIFTLRVIIERIHFNGYQSGQFESRNRHISKRGSSALRKACFEVMQALKLTKPQDDPVYLFMLKKEQEGKPYNVAKMAGVNKFLRIYYARAMELYR